MSTEQRKQVIALSDRLISIAHFCPRGSKVVDVGSGHGKLALYLRQTKIADYVIAVELNQDPLNRIKRLINSRNPQQINIDVRSGDGLQPVEADEMEIVCLAGLSSSTIVKILEAAKNKLNQTKRLILQPIAKPEQLRYWLITNGWQLIDEQIVAGQSRRLSKIHTILVAEPGKSLCTYQEANLEHDDLVYVGPILWQRREPLLHYKLRREQKHWKEALETILEADPEHPTRRNQIISRIEWLEFLINKW